MPENISVALQVLRHRREDGHAGEAALGRRRRLQELLEGGAREEGGKLHQRFAQERVPPKVHEQVHQVGSDRGICDQVSVRELGS